MFYFNKITYEPFNSIVAGINDCFLNLSFSWLKNVNIAKSNAKKTFNHKNILYIILYIFDY